MASNPSTPATSPQKPVLKQPLIDVWSTRERLALASCVHKQGDQNWYSVSRSIKPFAESIRPDDWFSTKNCALQYQDLLEKKEKEMKLTQPKRKRGERGEETPQELIVRDLTAQRLSELKAKIAEDTKKFQEIKELWEALHADNPPEDVLRKVWQKKLDEQRRKKEEAEAFEQFKKEREEKYKQAKATLRAGLLRTPSRTTTPRSQEGQPATPQKAKTPVKQPSPVKQGSPVKVSVKIDEPEVSTTPGKETAPLLTSLLAKSPSPTKTVSPTHPGFFTQAAAAQGKQLSPIGSPHKESTTPTSSAPTLCKLLDMPSSSSAQKIPPLPLVESSVKIADSSIDGQVISRSESVDSKGDVEVRSLSQEKKAPEGKVEKEDSTTPRPGRRGRKPRLEIQGITPKEGIATPASAPSSATVQTRRSARVRTVTPRSDSESRSFVEDKKQAEEPSGQSGHQGPPESASEESMDSFAPKSLLPSLPTDSLPPSPSSTLHSEDREAEREHRKWLKSIMEIVKLALTHKHATQFADPVLEEEAEGYHDCVKRPMDLFTIRMRLENQTAENAIRTTLEFQQAMMLIFRNAQFFNPPGHEIYQAAVEMEEEILPAIEAQLALEREQPHIPPPVPLTGGKIFTSGHSSRGQGDHLTSLEGKRRPGRPPGGSRVRGRGRGGGTASRTGTPYEMISRRRSRGASTDVEPTSNPPSTPASVTSSTTSATPATSSTAATTTSTVSGSTPASSTPATGGQGDSRSTRSAKKKSIVSQEQK